MQDRDTDRTAPNRMPYVVIDVGGEPHHFRLPSMLSIARLAQQAESSHVAALMALQGDLSPAHLMGIVRRTGPELCGILGALVGLAWFHQTKDLECPISDNRIDFGSAVFEELHEGGYTLEQIVVMAWDIGRLVWDESRLSQEVMDRAGFFPRSEGATSSAESTLV